MNCAKILRVLNKFLIVGLLLVSSHLFAQKEHWGYVDARSEKQSESYVLYLEKPIWSYRVNYNPFNPKLTGELRERYRQYFGYTDAEIGISQMEYFLQNNQTTGARTEGAAYLERQKDFANYVVSRYGESLLDEYIRETKSLRPAYEVKKRVTQLEVQPKEAKGKLKVHYNLSGNFLELRWLHPSYEIELTTDFIRGKFGPTEAQEYIWKFRKFFERDLQLDIYHRTHAELTDFVLSKQITANLRVQWQTHLDLLEEEGREGERRSYLGMSYSY
jgi:hypothetical protein